MSGSQDEPPVVATPAPLTKPAFGQELPFGRSVQFRRKRSKQARLRCYFVTVKCEALVTVPPAVVTEIGPVFAPFGTVASISVAETTVNCFALVPLNITALPPLKLLPVIVTDVPIGPLAGVKALITGGGITVKVFVLVAVPPGVVTEIGPLVAPCGTIAIIRDPFTWKLAVVPLTCTLVALARFVP